MFGVQRVQRVQAFQAVQVRTLRKGTALPKPRLRLKFDLDGNAKIPDKIPGWDTDEREKYVKWLQRTSEKIARDIGQKSGERFASELKREMQNYVSSFWGRQQAALKSVVRRKRARARKERRDNLLLKKMAEWQKLEDMREDKIIRDRSREQRELRREPFSLNIFLRSKRRKAQDLAYLSVDPNLTEEEQVQFIASAVESDRDNYLFKPPKTVRRKYHPTIEPKLGYEKRLERELVDPWLHEIRRRARAADLVAKYEEAFNRAKWLIKKKQDEVERNERREAEWLKRREHWHKVLGDWHAEQNQVRSLQADFMEYRNFMFAEARAQFLQALEDDVSKWVETPNECRYLRFRFAEGVQFPFTKADYI